MSLERRPADDPREWLNRARSNLTRAKAGVDLAGIYLEDLCFDAQQAAEKALKAVLLHRNIPFPYVHDLAELVTVLQQAGTAPPAAVTDAAKLTRFAVETRYPGLGEPVTHEEYLKAVSIAESVVRWAEVQLTRSG